MKLTRRTLARIALWGTPALALGGWAFVPRGTDRRDGRNDRRENGLWLSHAWIGDDLWFRLNHKEDLLPRYRSDEAREELRQRCVAAGIRDLFPHLCPAQPDASVLPIHAPSLARLAALLPDARILPWVGGALGVHIHFDDAAWRAKFVASVRALVDAQPALAGVHLNVEPCPSGSPGMLHLLDELRAALPAEKLLSLAAYPPPSLLHPFADVHWDETFYRALASRVSQLVPMLYDTALHLRMPYRGLVRAWAHEVLQWAGATPTLLGLPAYDDRGTGYHDPDVENLDNALAGVHAALGDAPLPDAYRGVALYADWEIDDAEWALFAERFGAR